jgi:hypothetical protein
LIAKPWNAPITSYRGWWRAIDAPRECGRAGNI